MVRVVNLLTYLFTSWCCGLVALCRSSVHGALQTASASDKPSLQQHLAQIDRDIETANKEITKMSFVVPQARHRLCRRNSL